MLSSHKDTLQWCSKAIQIRTVFVADSYLQLREGDGFRAFLVVEGDHHFIIVQKNRVGEGVDEHLAMDMLPHVQLTETVEPEGHKLCADLGLASFSQASLLSSSSRRFSISSSRSFVERVRMPC